MRVYYNENDPFAAAWLRKLMIDERIPRGFIDTRSIADVRSKDVKGYDQCHFFAGIGGWAYALELAGWERPVWTGSCPCQPFSVAGQRKGTTDKRHLWPEFQRLIAECRPPVVFGEQVASKDGRVWLAGVRADLEALGYGVGAADLCAAGVGAPHIRQRLYWVADTNVPQSHRRNASGGEQSLRDGCGDTGGMVNAEGQQARLPGRAWQSRSTIECTDGKTRVFESGIFPLAHGVPNRMGTLRGAGNAICAPLAAEFVGAYLDILNTAQ